MKTLNISRWMTVLFLVPSCFIITNCSDFQEEGLNEVTPPGSNDWVAMLDELYYDYGIIVEKDRSIQDAVNEARSGEAIYIEPGIYREAINISKPDIKLIGLSNDKGEGVVIDNSITISPDYQAEIINIQFKNSNASSSSQSPGNSRVSRGKIKMTREELHDNIAHYTFEVPLGKGPHSVGRIHRVVREHKPYQPVFARGSVFILHGAANSFNAVFLKAGSSAVDPQTSPAFYLASKNIDVWGLDFAWTLVPEETTDFTFMKDWGVERDASHASAALSIARLIRGLTWQGFGRMNLLGYSYGAIVAYAAANNETQQHPLLRDIKGLVAVDQVIKYAPEDEDSRVTVCGSVQTFLDQLNNQVYQNTNGQFFAAIGNLALNTPNDISPFNNPNNPNPFTNYQFALAAGINPPAVPPAPGWHFVGGTPPVAGLFYTEESRWFRLLSSLPPYQPMRIVYETRVCLCDEEDVAFDDHLDKIKVPILYLGAGGGFGTLGEYTSSLTSSTDVTHHTISLQPADQRNIDFGHGDLVLGNEAADLVWEKLRIWLMNHNNPGFY